MVRQSYGSDAVVREAIIGKPIRPRIGANRRFEGRIWFLLAFIRPKVTLLFARRADSPTNSARHRKRCANPPLIQIDLQSARYGVLCTFPRGALAMGGRGDSVAETFASCSRLNIRFLYGAANSTGGDRSAVGGGFN